MAKKSLKSESKGSGPKRKLSSNETEVGTEENINKGKSKRTKIEEAPSPIPEMPIAPDNKVQGKRQKHENVEATVLKKKKKEKQIEIAEQPSLPVDASENEEEEDLSPEEERFLERKLKKIRKKEEINRLRAEGKWVPKAQQNVAKEPVAPKQALDYLTCWENNRQEWKFQKTRQTWLLQHMFDSGKIPDESFSVLLSYVEGLRGAARDTTIHKAETLIRELGEGPLDEDVQQRACRAREVIQLLG